MFPPTPATRFLARLIEDFADEWLPLPLMAFRWTSDEDVAFCAVGRCRVGWAPSARTNWPPASPVSPPASRRLRTILGAGNPAVMGAMFLAQYAALLDVLEAGLSQAAVPVR